LALLNSTPRAGPTSAPSSLPGGIVHYSPADTKPRMSLEKRREPPRVSVKSRTPHTL